MLRSQCYELVFLGGDGFIPLRRNGDAIVWWSYLLRDLFAYEVLHLARAELAVRAMTAQCCWSAWPSLLPPCGWDPSLPLGWSRTNIIYSSQFNYNLLHFVSIRK